MIIKIDFRDGAGNGEVIWRLGREGDFSIVSGEPNPWFTHPHQPEFISANQLSVFDNGNTRVEETDIPFSRGQIYELDEVNMTATLLLSVDLGNYSPALGSSQPLSNGNLHFNTGHQGTRDGALATSMEILPDGSIAHVVDSFASMYRSFRLQNLYSIPGGESLE